MTADQYTGLQRLILTVRDELRDEFKRELKSELNSQLSSHLQNGLQGLRDEMNARFDEAATVQNEILNIIGAEHEAFADTDALHTHVLRDHETRLSRLEGTAA